MFTKTSKLKAHQKKPFTYAHVTKNDKKYIFFSKKFRKFHRMALCPFLWHYIDQYLAFVLGWNQTGFVRNLFASKIYHSIDSQKQKKFKKFNNFQFKIGSIRK